MGPKLEGDRWGTGEDFIFYNKIYNKTCLHADGNDPVERKNLIIRSEGIISGAKSLQ